MKILKDEIAKLIVDETGIEYNEILAALTIPPKTDMGDLALPCFNIARKLGKSPNEFAQETADKISSKIKDDSLIKATRAFGPYTNFFVNKAKFFSLIVNEFVNSGVKNLRLPDNKKNIVIDYSSPNIAKPIAIHHIRSTVIGNILGNIFENCGYTVTRINYLGDWGTQFGKLITAFEKFGNENKLEKEGIKHLLDIYVKYHQEENEDMENKSRQWFKKAESGDTAAINYWKKFKSISLKEFQQVYSRLNVKFTSTEGESQYNDKVDSLMELINKKAGTRHSDGALIIDLEKYNLPPVLLKKTDGATLYATRDIAAALDRWERYRFDESLYVVAHQQELHFKQLFKTLEIMGYSWADRCRHISFGMLHFDDARMSTREGRVIFLEEVLDRAVDLALKAINHKNPKLENKEEVAEAVGIGAVIFSDISKRRIQNVVFRWEDVLNFDGETAPYVQYTHARTCSLLAKADFDINSVDSIEGYEPTPMEFELIKFLTQFSGKLLEAKNEYEPFIIARYVLDLAKLFNRYYYQEKIIDNPDKQKRKAKLLLVLAIRELIAHCLSIIGIKAPERM
ncbi:MAG: arginine--tRNA ligase [Oligoflexia bacterium]|nr:arginine--tRNA ligase [Oligoflexia bacterium]